MSLTMAGLFFLFATVVFGLYFCLPKKYRYIVLLVFSVAMVSFYSEYLVLCLVATALSIYSAGLCFNGLDNKCKTLREGKEKEEKKAIKQKFKNIKLLILWIYIIFNLGILVFFKYANFLGSIYTGILSWFNVTKKLPILKLALPLGISYYTLSAIGYMIDVYRGKYSAEKNPLKILLFVCYFPQLTEGPFATYDKVGIQLGEGHSFDSERVVKGIVSAFWGLFKIFFIANRFAIIADSVFRGYHTMSGAMVLLGILAFTVQLYAEFSGTIDIASGISEMFGITLAKNFEQPFFSQTVSEFWRRWHMSLGTWFKEYIFYSITMSKGMTRLNKKLHGKVNKFFELFIPSCIALFVVWLLNGLWHGADYKYVVYGLYYFVIMTLGMCFEPLFDIIYKKRGIDKNSKVVKWIKIIRTFIIVNIGLLMFRAANLTVFGEMFAKIFSGGEFGVLKIIKAKEPMLNPVIELVLTVVGLAMLVAVDILSEKKVDIRAKLTSKWWIAFIVIFLLVFGTLIFGAYGDGYIKVDAIYGGF